MPVCIKSIVMLAIFALLFLFPAGMKAGEGDKSGAGAGCRPPFWLEVKVREVKDDGSIMLEGGEELRLIGVFLPRLLAAPHSRTARRLNAIALEGVALLRSLVPRGSMLRLYSDGRQYDRYGRLLAHAYGRKGKWLQGELLARGLGRAYSYRDNRACMAQMLRLEERARKQQAGLWAIRAMQPLQASNPSQILRHRYRFTLIEGRVLKAAQTRKWVFLNFGQNYRRDFTIAIKNKYARQMKKEGLDPLSLAGRRVRVRGWVEYWGGPVIKAGHRQQIEPLDGLPPAAGLRR